MIVFPLFFNISCMSTSVKRFKTAEYKGIQDSLVDINLFGTRVEPVQEKNSHDLLLLSDRGQSEFIKSLAQRYKDSNDINIYINALKGEYFNVDKPTIVDYSNKDLKMIFTISKNLNYEDLGNSAGTFSPADRIEYLKFTLKLDPNTGIKFTKWNRYSTQYDTLNIAEMTFSKRVEGGGSIGGGLGGITGQISGKSEQMTQEQQNIRHRYILLNGSINDSSISIEEEGVRDIDLAGNVIADVSMKFPDTLFRVVTVSDLKDNKNDTFFEPERLKMRFDLVYIPNFKDSLPDEIKAHLSVKYIYRHVISGYDTYYEWDDRVGYYKGNEEKDIVLYKKEDYLPPFFYIGLDGDDNYSRNSSIIVQDTLSRQNYMLVFRQYWEARDFYKWLINLSSKSDIEPVKIQHYNLILWTSNKKSSINRDAIIDAKFTIYKLSELTRLMSIN